MTGERSHSGILRSSADIKVSKVTAVSQLAKVQKNSDKLKRQIARLKDEKNNSATSVERKNYLEGAIYRTEKRLTKTIMSVIALNAKVVKSQEQWQKQKEKEEQEAKIRAANATKIRPQVPKYDNGLGNRRPGQGKIVERVEIVGKHRRVRRKYLLKS
jgi:cell division protein FtsB